MPDLEIVIVVLGVLHFGTPMVYYLYLRRHLDEPWQLESNDESTRRVTVLIPTYNEELTIRDRLDNLYLQDYPHNLVDVRVVDAGNDGTSALIRAWCNSHPDLRLTLTQSKERVGKLHDVLLALNLVPNDTDIIVLSDADTSWGKSALGLALKYFNDKKVAAVTASITYTNSTDESLENAYRGYFNNVRIAESKLYSTPVLNGPFLALRAAVVRKAGVPTFEGSDDSAIGSFFAFIGYRSLQADDILVTEPIRGNQSLRRIRRAQHLIQSFLHTKSYAKQRKLYLKSKFDMIWRIEFWLHIVNPIILFLGLGLITLALVSNHSLLDLLLLAGIVFPIPFKPYRTWMLQQFYLAAAMLRNIWTRDILWER